MQLTRVGAAARAARRGLASPAGNTVWNVLHRALPQQISVREPLPGLKTVEGLVAPAPSQIQTTALSNGVRIVTHEGVASPVTSIAAFADAGSMYEGAHEQGVSALLARMAFTATENRSQFRIEREISDTGGAHIASRTREHLIWATEFCRPSNATALFIDTLADTIRNTTFEPSVVEAKKESLMEEMKNTYSGGFDLGGNMALDHAGSVSIDLLHRAAFTGGLSNAYLPSPSAVGALSGEATAAFAERCISGPGLTIVGAGVDHNEFVMLAESAFGGIAGAKGAAAETSAYVGGQATYSSPVELTTISLGFQAPADSHKDSAAASVLATMMGGGNSFSAGGPGKGLLARLYTNVLNRHGWMLTASASLASYAHSGLLCLTGTAAGSQGASAAAVLAEAAHMLAVPPSDEELARAKAQCKSEVLRMVESRPLLMEQLGRSLSLNGSIETPSDIAAKIDAVTADDVARVGKAALSSQLSYSIYGSTANAMPYDDVVSKISSK